MKKNKKKIIKTAATISGIGVLIANLFESPKDIINNEPINNAHIETINNKTHINLVSTIIEKIPLLFKIFVLIPLWIIGSIIIKIINKLLLLITSPILKFLLRTLIIFIILLIIVLLILKLLFPDKKIKELINKKLIISIFIASIILNITDLILMKNTKYQKIKSIIIFSLGLILILLILRPFIIKKYYEPKIIYDHSIYD